MASEIYHYQEILFGTVEILQAKAFFDCTHFTFRSEEEGIVFSMDGTPLWEYPFSDKPKENGFDHYAGGVMKRRKLIHDPQKTRPPYFENFTGTVGKLYL